MLYFLYSIRWTERERYIIWFTDDVDGVALDKQGSIANFLSIESAAAFAKCRGTVSDEKPSPQLDLTWIPEVTPRNLDCVMTLNVWNFFVDVASSLRNVVSSEFSTLEKEQGKTYEKLFWGNNLPAITPSGERYEPVWSQEEVTEIRQIFQIGLSLFLNNLAEAVP